MAYRSHEKESRWGDRVNVNIPVRLWADTVAGVDACMSNLSLSGALVTAHVDLGLRSMIEVSIKMPTAQRTDALTAYVSRKVEEGFGGNGASSPRQS